MVASTHRKTRDQFESINAQTPGKAVTLHGPEGKENHHQGLYGEICKTSTPGSNPGGASTFPSKFAVPAPPSARAGSCVAKV